jgi:hypothetical protein
LDKLYILKLARVVRLPLENNNSSNNNNRKTKDLNNQKMKITTITTTTKSDPFLFELETLHPFSTNFYYNLL